MCTPSYYIEYSTTARGCIANTLQHAWVSNFLVHYFMYLVCYLINQTFIIKTIRECLTRTYSTKSLYIFYYGLLLRGYHTLVEQSFILFCNINTHQQFFVISNSVIYSKISDTLSVILHRLQWQLNTLPWHFCYELLLLIYNYVAPTNYSVFLRYLWVSKAAAGVFTAFYE